MSPVYFSIQKNFAFQRKSSRQTKLCFGHALEYVDSTGKPRDICLLAQDNKKFETHQLAQLAGQAGRQVGLYSTKYAFHNVIIETAWKGFAT